MPPLQGVIQNLMFERYKHSVPPGLRGGWACPRCFRLFLELVFEV